MDLVLRNKYVNYCSLSNKNDTSSKILFFLLAVVVSFSEIWQRILLSSLFLIRFKKFALDINQAIASVVQLFDRFISPTRTCRMNLTLRHFRHTSLLNSKSNQVNADNIYTHTRRCLFARTLRYKIKLVFPLSRNIRKTFSQYPRGVCEEFNLSYLYVKLQLLNPIVSSARCLSVT